MRSLILFFMILSVVPTTVPHTQWFPQNSWWRNKSCIPAPLNFLHLWETLVCFQGSGPFSISRALHLKSSPCMLFLPLCLVKLYSFLQSRPKWTLPYSRLPWSWTRSVIPIVSSNSTRYFSIIALTTVLQYLCVCSVTQSCSTLLWPHGLYSTKLLCSWNFPGENTGGGCHFFLQNIFLAQGSNLCLLCVLHWEVDSLPLSHQGQFTWVIIYLRSVPSTGM